MIYIFMSIFFIAIAFVVAINIYFSKEIARMNSEHLKEFKETERTDMQVW